MWILLALRQQLTHHPVWITVIRCSVVSQTLCCGSCSLFRTPLHDWSLACDIATTSCQCYTSSTGCQSERVSFKMACRVRQSLSGQAPVYLADDCCLVSDSARHSLQLADVLICIVPRTYSSYSDRTFAAAGPHLHLRNPDITYRLLRRQLKGHVFGNHLHGALCLRKTFTYLLQHSSCTSEQAPMSPA